jgi:hypothetical protein
MEDCTHLCYDKEATDPGMRQKSTGIGKYEKTEEKTI